MALRASTPALAANLSSNLRYVRERQGITQQALARRAGIPRSTVAHLESGSANPTLDVLVRIAGALELALEELLSAPHARCQLFPKGSLPVETRGTGGLAEIRRLLPDSIPGMEIDRIEVPPGTRLGGVPHRPGTREFLYCERGRLTLATAGERLVLAAGDVAAFQGDQPHSYSNESTAPAVGFSVVTLAPAGNKLGPPNVRDE